MSSILVVEDDRSTRQLLTEMLKTAGFSVTSAKDGERRSADRSPGPGARMSQNSGADAITQTATWRRSPLFTATSPTRVKFRRF